MSIDLNWETLTSGPDGDALAESIRSFIHAKFQTVPLPRFIRSVNVHGFDFGTIPPELELKDITDPLPDFYEQELEEDDEGDEDESEEDEQSIAERERLAAAAAVMEARKRENGLREALKSEMSGHDLGRAFLGTSTPGILGGPGRNYFQAHLATGTHTPLAAVAGAHLGTSWMGSTAGSVAQTPHHSREASLSSIDNFRAALDPGPGPSVGAKSDVSSTPGPPSRPSTSHGPVGGDERAPEPEPEPGTTTPPRREPRVEDVQAVFRIRYSGDVRLNLTAEILLDYPMPSFVGIPLKLNITGLTFDGVGVLAHIRKRVHFCFLNPDDALAAVGPEAEEESSTAAAAAAATGSGGGDPQVPGKKQAGGRFGGLLQEIKVESEIGERESGRQSLKNVGKVERFVLEQVRRIFEEEFVYPSFWTFLV
ncbi:phosphatidylinositol 4-phosphate 5-kinase [Trichoderma cornu-damae]|uniref:Mitochondrial distribution and morphology protein 12 n=1 Tax=Trichoderma cornu-damae TaxID=654480 RepID=A0A9P8QSH4_9HYPO|nr:phosphatidylinositol 4-phosphate 5-kinase [Trichoderma cornu-damae]